ncbi:N-acetylmuramoyl-L-alanine amidase [Anabaena sp. FACHB-1237]|uniref:N-acetylmuramoyl-L-alanine amidase n=1 Tax=Anabaena sp. FACHB-1237 TaxID=2692769 RepID=UPI001680B05A|nr:peptidoglycan recognition family protein [Anabaena sp. FACHB-1237]MBD2136907.1 N-acetylmuramoyl-L-alanine amidase [Anabaena sp. FACHB-1237]
MIFSDWLKRFIFILLIVVSLFVSLFVFGMRHKEQSGNLVSTVTGPVVGEYPMMSVPSFASSPQQVTTQKKSLEQKILQQTAVKEKSVSPTPAKIKPVYGGYVTTAAFAIYKPRYQVVAVNPTNYGDRYSTDVNGNPVNNQAIIVLHETSNSASSAINFFKNTNNDENVQASYHALIALDGRVIYLVPPDKRAFGAGNSVFDGGNGVETVQTNPNLPPSVNNFAYHVSLETPPDAWGKENITGHSGYTDAQYNSLAWLIAQSQVPDDRITTHKAVDRSGRKVDPLSFDFDKFFNLLHRFRTLA